MGKTRKDFRGFSLVLKIISVIVAVAIIILIIDFFTGDNTWHTVVTEIHKDCYIECLDNNMQSIFYYADGDETQKKYIVEEWEAILMYASDGKDTVAFQCVDDSAGVKENKSVIFNTETKEKISFTTQVELLDFCEKENIVLSDWKMPHCRSYY